ncbi:28563_t:CDS:1, partial [Dentiscutata erythropus]
MTVAFMSNTYEKTSKHAKSVWISFMADITAELELAEYIHEYIFAFVNHITM